MNNVVFQGVCHLILADQSEGLMINDVAETVTVRSELTVLCAELENGRALHFCGHPVLSGINHDVWFPLAQGEDLFSATERVMVMNHQAVNVTRMEPLAQSVRCDDYRVTFNVRITELKI